FFNLTICFGFANPPVVFKHTCFKVIAAKLGILPDELPLGLKDVLRPCIHHGNDPESKIHGGFPYHGYSTRSECNLQNHRSTVDSSNRHLTIGQALKGLIEDFADIA